MPQKLDRIAVTEASPFDLYNQVAYQAWREKKLAHYPCRVEQLVVEIAHPAKLTTIEYSEIKARCKRFNMAIYANSKMVSGKEALHGFGEQFGLRRLDKHECTDEDGISVLQDRDMGNRQGYIPYSNSAINWHTDGYYNPLDHKIKAMLLHCVSPAVEGGDNTVMDHEMVYLLMRDENPAYINALMHPRAMTIPANIREGREIRAEQAGPVFSVDTRTGHLHMRYTARTRSIEWRPDATTRAAVRFLEKLLTEATQYQFQLRLDAGYGLICNNVLHNRSAFKDNTDQGMQRLLYRARYYDRIS